MNRNKLFVKNLDNAATQKQIEFMFSGFGDVNFVKYNRNKGYALVEMSTTSEAKNALVGLDGSRLMGRAMNVREIPSTIKWKILSVLGKFIF